MIYKRRIMGVDVARLGVDLTVFIWGVKIWDDDGNTFYIMEGVESYSKQDTMTSIGKMFALAKRENISMINIDNIGLGSTFYDRAREVCAEQNLGIIINGCNFASSAGSNNKGKGAKYLNKKAETYFYLEKLIRESKIRLLDHAKLKKELSMMRWELTSGGKIKIIDPEKSPDFADALIYFIWNTNIKHGKSGRSYIA